MARSFEIEVNPEVLKWARESAGLTSEEVAKKLKTSLDIYEKIEKGIKKPTYRQIEILAKYLKRPISAFFLPEPPQEKPISLSFRIMPFSESEISNELRLAIRKARYYQSIASEIMEELRMDTHPYISRCAINSDPAKIARRERESIKITIDEQIKWKNAYQAFNVWRSVIEEKNILIFQFKFPVEEARGFSLIDTQPYLIVLNSNDNILARIFTMFHEYAHLLLGITEIYSEEKITDTEVENWCNTFAGEFLLPYEVIKEDEDFKILIESKGAENQILEKLSKKYKVSKKAIIVRLKMFNLINEEIYKNQIQMLETKEVEKKKGFMTPIQKCLQEKGIKFPSAILEAKEKGIITSHDAIDYLSIKLRHFNELQQKLST